MPPGTASPDDARLPSQRIADDLRRAIESGDLAPGDQLPSERELASRYSTARNTAREGIRVLVEAGLVERHHGKGAFVRPHGPVQRVAFDRYRQVLRKVSDTAAGSTLKEAAFTRDQGIPWGEYRLDKDFQEVPAAGAVAELLDLEPGTPVLARHFVFFASGRPKQLSVSHLPVDLIAHTPVADPTNEPWPGGTIAQLDSLGVTVTRVEESVRARMPTPTEQDVLEIPQGVPVLTVTRRMLANDRPVEAAVDIVMPADRFVLDYAVDL